MKFFENFGQNWANFDRKCPFFKKKRFIQNHIHPFFCKNVLCKNVEAEICLKFKNLRMFRDSNSKLIL